ncbi:hypothetical protein [Streptomyces xanthophaeus]|uniref:hypothetical protein n=1 Tax=Streptomyces xanthophaeus TaxID=67385 RepID=UPI003F4D43FB
MGKSDGHSGECFPQVFQALGVFHRGDEVAEGFAGAESGGEGVAFDERGPPRELRPACSGEQGCGGDIDPCVHERRADTNNKIDYVAVP